MKEHNELVKDYCPDDCIYRVLLESCIPACYYAVIERRSRGCKVSECDKYKGGIPKRPTMDKEYMIYWEYELYGKDDNLVW